MTRYLVLLLLCFNGAFAQRDSLRPSVHDPVMIKQDSVYYLFCTGNGISVWSSTDLQQWKREQPVFSTPPEWAVAAVPGYKGHTWAPDISYHNGLYYLFYSVSTFGKNTSAIGVATNKTLHPSSPDYRWADHGLVIASRAALDWNAIDPNLVIDKGTPWLAFGSFWSGLKMVKLDKTLLHADTTTIHAIASRRGTGVARGNNAIEAPFIFKRDGYFYLFASTDFCCRGEKSDYKMVVGRSRKVTGPYTDKSGTDMMIGGGTLLLEGNKDWYGVGHNAVCTFEGKDYLVFHGYDAADKGRSKLRVEALDWVDGWPVVK